MSTFATLPCADDLQALTETAVAHRERHELLAHELVVPVIEIAQRLAGQLAAYGFTGQCWWGHDEGAKCPSLRDDPYGVMTEAGHGRLRTIDDAKTMEEKYRRNAEDGRRLYSLQRVTWKTGKWRHRESHEGMVLVYEQGVFMRRPLWNPGRSANLWDFENPPCIHEDTFKELTMNFARRVCQLPTSTILAQFGQDAEQLAESIATRESEHTEHLSAGLEGAESALARLCTAQP